VSEGWDDAGGEEDADGALSDLDLALDLDEDEDEDDSVDDGSSAVDDWVDDAD